MTDAFITETIKSFREKFTYGGITGISKTTFYYRVKYEGATEEEALRPQTKKHLTPEVVKQIITLRDQGLSYGEIAKKLGIKSRATVYRRLKELNHE